MRKASDLIYPLAVPGKLSTFTSPIHTSDELIGFQRVWYEVRNPKLPGDCVIRAFSNLLDVPYENIWKEWKEIYHKIHADIKESDIQEYPWGTDYWMRKYLGQKYSVAQISEYRPEKDRLTITQLGSKYPNCLFNIKIGRNGHTACIKDGVYWDREDRKMRGKYERKTIGEVLAPWR